MLAILIIPVVVLAFVWYLSALKKRKVDSIDEGQAGLTGEMQLKVEEAIQKKKEEEKKKTNDPKTKKS